MQVNIKYEKPNNILCNLIYKIELLNFDYVKYNIY